MISLALALGARRRDGQWTFVTVLDLFLGRTMAINAPVLELLLKSAAQTQGPKRLVCLGYPDMLVTEAQLAKLCGGDVLDRIQFREDSKSILQWYHLADSMTRIAESQSLFTALGI